MGQEGRRTQAAKANWDSKVEGRGFYTVILGKRAQSRKGLERWEMRVIYKVLYNPDSQVDSRRKPLANAICDDRGDIDYFATRISTSVGNLHE